ncbi:glycosyltransferase involved in cell wall biosynthesis [Knoellia remsis]|uniref:D-inositol 3-phosphate glycosyltransferase n=1 Tax=Knoellia remsis TaxID=407159 RepID=A0A2T0UZE4_9MICO|nr:glycosyltransferase [Knoellia remsis]PRY63208.1 glycosyltransferase involved in cell wall biosynthesis [Knoellia remsis]
MSVRPRVAIAHDYLTQRGGAERVVLAMARAFPGARIHTTLYDPDGTYPEFRDLDIVTSPLNRVGVLRRRHRLALPLLAPAASATRIDADVVLASSSGWAHGFHSSGALLVYCHAPARWLHQRDEYLGAHGSRGLSGIALGLLAPALRRWDQRAAARADAYLANSRVVRDRIHAAYGITAEVLPPPHGVTADGPTEPVPELAGWDDYHLVVSRLLPYKNVDVAVEAFRGLPDDRLVVVGDGPLRDVLAASLPDNVRLVSHLSDAQLRWTYAGARALVAPSLEDFGLTPLEAAAFGHPTIALEAGGYLDTVVPGRTGVFFTDATPSAVRRAVRNAAGLPWVSDDLRAHAASFGEERFADALRSQVRAVLREAGMR